MMRGFVDRNCEAMLRLVVGNIASQTQVIDAVLKSPPQIIWLTCGNTSNVRLLEILSSVLPEALELLHSGEKLVAISGD